jgi:hypothetical protein
MTQTAKLKFNLVILRHLRQGVQCNEYAMFG